MLDALQVILILLFAPFLQGFIHQVKARLQGRRGASPWQPYREYRKLLGKDRLLSTSASPITRVAPVFIVGLLIAGCATLPALTSSAPLLAGGSFFVFLSLLAFARFATLMLGLDSGSAFAGMGAGRDLLFGVLTEPIVLLSLIAAGLQRAAFSFPSLLAVHASSDIWGKLPATLLVLIALLMVLIVETGRLPIDNPDTHLELTMIHEGLTLELTGRDLALIKWAAAIRQTLWFTLWLDVCLPVGIATTVAPGPLLVALLLWVGKCLLLGLVVAVLESLSAKMRIFLVPRYLSFALTLAVIAILADAAL
ncbi:MAG: NADH-quinone oxidoreductase subunit H [Firmicutes bacterium]|nr:NADH-quinone oxidoreductase subunit H [Bacillota bacterium]